MPKKIDLTGHKYGKLTVIREDIDNPKRKPGKIMWLCLCECGNYTSACTNDLRIGDTKSCGCLKYDGSSAITHGFSKERLYHIWLNMRQRCKNPKHPSYVNYGERGIFVCEEWDDYLNFRGWAMSNGYQDDLTIDRIDNDGGYSPDNCRWTGRDIQSHNKRSNRMLTFKDKTQDITQWAEETGISFSAIISRLDKYGWSVEDTLTIPAYEKKYFEYKGESHTMKEWADLYGYPYELVCNRLTRQGWSIEKTLLTPPFEPISLEYNGEKHSIKDWANIVGIPEDVIRNRSRKLKWSVERTLTTPYNRRCVNE